MKAKLTLIIILLIAAVFRLTGVDWDQSFHLHPDERFLAMVVNDIKLPTSWAEYFNPKESSLNPYNHQFDFFVYGHLPINLSKWLAVKLNNDLYGQFVLQGRVTSALLDLVIILFIYKIGQNLERIDSEKILKKKGHLGPSFKIWACLFYALAVLPIQLSHFFTVDPWLNFFMLLSFYASLKFYFTTKPTRSNQTTSKKPTTKKTNQLVWFSLSAFSLAAALASKLNALLLLPLNLLLLTGQPLRQTLSRALTQQSNQQVKKNSELGFAQQELAHLTPFLLVYLLLTYLGLRIFDPYLFAQANWFNPTISSQFIKNFKTLKSFTGQDVWYPPSIQWLNKTPVWFAFKNLAVFGLGLPITGLLLFGLFHLITKLSKHLKHSLHQAKKITALVKPLTKNLTWPVLLTTGWVLTYFLYQSTQFVKSLRYFIMLYPFLALLASYGWLQLKNFLDSKLPLSQYLLNLSLLLAISLWPLMFLSIYLKPHSRIQASRWLYANLNDGQQLAFEHWDDPLPLSLSGQTKKFNGQMLPVFGPDNQQKWSEIDQILATSDYYLLTSNRAWGSISQAPDRYPKMSQFYQQLLKGQAQQLGFKKVAQFTSYPSLEYLGLPLTLKDDWAEEAFTVYDHPQVIVFKKIEPHPKQPPQSNQ